jgi:hypothetical protein
MPIIENVKFRTLPRAMFLLVVAGICLIYIVLGGFLIFLGKSFVGIPFQDSAAVVLDCVKTALAFIFCCKRPSDSILQANACDKS